MRHALTSCMGLAVVFGVAEVLVRYGISAETYHASQLSLAVFANVGILGLIALLLVGGGALLGRGVRGLGMKARFAVVSQIEYGVLGSVVVVLLIATDAVSVVDANPTAQLACAVVAGVGTWVCASYAKVFARPPLSAVARGGVVVGWASCLGMTLASVTYTHAHVQRWMQSVDTNPSNAAPSTPNIVLIVLDTLRADRVGVYSDTSLTPNLDSLANSSIVYANALSTAPWTLPTHASLFTGVYPERHGVDWGHYYLDDRFDTLAELLRRGGYDTFALSNNWLLSEQNGFARGFDSFLETSRDPFLSRWRLALHCGTMRPVKKWIGLSEDAGRDAGSGWTNWLMRARLARQRRTNSPFFAFINYFEPHDPYRPPHRYLEHLLTPAQRETYARFPQRVNHLAAHACGVSGVYSKEQIALMSALYAAEVAYQDEVVGDLITGLKEEGRLDDTWIVITSDHGELFGEGDMVYHTAGSHYKLLHVPLIVRPPGGVTHRIVEVQVQPVDVFATLLGVGRMGMPEQVTRAHPLPMKDGEPGGRTVSIAQTHGASIAGLSSAQRMDMQADLSHWLTWVTSVQSDGYLLEMDSNGPRGLFDLNIDPDMNENLTDLLPDVVELLLAKFRDWSAQAVCGDVL